jgi:hypothetical protein
MADILPSGIWAMLQSSLRLLVKGAVAALVIGCLCLPAHAFQESTVGGSAGKPAAGISAAPPGLDLRLPDVSASKGTGTEVRIPGVGTLGVLPKLDLGLELLYGSDTPSSRPYEKPDEGLQLRATIKHRF